MSPIELRVAGASTKTLEALRKQGLLVNERYGYDAPALPGDITSLPDEEVMDLYGKYVAYLEFINLQLWCAETDRAEADKVVALTKAKKKLAFKNAKVAISMIDAEIEIDSEYREKADALQELTNYYNLIHIISDRLSKDISLINREITRRVNLNKSAGRSTWLLP